MPTARRVLVGMSGGIDSTLAAALLLQAGYHVRGAILVLDARGFDQVADVAEICAQLDIQLDILDVRRRFEADVIAPFLAAYSCGLTPNPCVFCNPLLKFDALFSHAEQHGFQYVATGHYAHVGKYELTNRWCLLRSQAGTKDQSYFLYRLSQSQLARVLFPLAHNTKTAVRERVAALELAGFDPAALAARKESQDICFIPGNDYRAFASMRNEPFAASRKGWVLDEYGNPLGKHTGAWRYTIGQRKGFEVKTTDRLYVISKNIQNNTITVGPRSAVYRDHIILQDLIYSGWEQPVPNQQLRAQIRSSAAPAPCSVATDTNERGARLHVHFDEPVFAPAAGQSCVLYDGEAIVAGGLIA